MNTWTSGGRESCSGALQGYDLYSRGPLWTWVVCVSRGSPCGCFRAFLDLGGFADARLLSIW